MTKLFRDWNWDTVINIILGLIVVGLVVGACFLIVKGNERADTMFKETCQLFKDMGYTVHYTWMDCNVLIKDVWYFIRPAQ